jgi:cytochrome c oxidase subunit II
MATTPGSTTHDSGRVAERAELRWALLVVSIVVVLIGMMVYMSLHWATMPPARVEAIDPTTLHLAGEFVEDNLGTAAEPDGSVTVRVVGNQYSFTPQCLLVPTDTPVKFRGTSADVVHGFNIAMTNVNLMLVPGYIATFKTKFKQPADLVMPCHEFCGVGHAAMWAHVKVIDKAEFYKQASGERRLSCVK